MVTNAAAMAVVKAGAPGLPGRPRRRRLRRLPRCRLLPLRRRPRRAHRSPAHSMDNCYAFLYVKEEKGKKKHIVMKCLVIDESLTIDVMDVGAQQEPYHVQINVKDFFSEEQPKNYGDMYKNFTGFIETLNSSVLCKLNGKDADAEKKPDVESSSSMRTDTSAAARRHKRKLGAHGRKPVAHGELFEDDLEVDKEA